MKPRANRYPIIKRVSVVLFSTLFLTAALGGEPFQGPPSSRYYGYGTGKTHSVHMVKMEVLGQKQAGEWDVAELRESQKSEVVHFADTLRCLQAEAHRTHSPSCTSGN